MKWQQFKTKANGALRRFMYGRNGVDQLTVFVLTISLIITILASMLRVPWLLVLYYFGVFSALYRIFSKSLVKRRLENRLFLQKTSFITSWFRVQRQIVQERKTHSHFKCPSCKQRLRVPKGRGKIKITCSKCGEEFSRKS